MIGDGTLPAPGAPVLDVGAVVLDRYRLVAPLGAGGMGAVWRAADGVLGREVALKVVALGDPLARARFLREGKLAARLDHRGLCKIFDVGEAPGQGFLVMELLAGTTLFRAMTAGLPLPAALASLAEVARAMDHAHAAGLVHRDLKPDNVFLDRKGDVERAVVIDFGLAFAIDGDAAVGRLTSADVTGGTPAYMSPEQARAGELTAASDVYALGCVLFEAVAGRPPFEGAPALIMSKHVYTAPPALAVIAPDAPPPLALLVSRMLQKRPPDRPTMREVAVECDRVAELLGTGAWRPGVGFGRGRLAEDRAHRMVTRTETSHAGPADAPHGTVALVGPIADDVMLALAAIGVASVRVDAPAAAVDLLVVDGPDAAVAAALATGRPVIGTVAAGDIDGAMRLAKLGAADVLTRPIAADLAARKIERRLRRTKPGRS